MKKANVSFIGMSGLIILVVIVVLILILFAPAPVSSGDCTAQCTEHTKQSDTPIVDASICGSGCLIKSITYNIAIEGYTITCRCCDCVGSTSAGLGTCNYPIGVMFNPLGSALGICKL